MKPWVAWSVVFSLAAVSAGALLLPPVPLALLAVASFVLLRKGRTGFLVFASVSAAINVALLSALVQQGATWRFGPLLFSGGGAELGAWGAIRVVAAVGGNLALLSWFPPEPVVDGLRLPRRFTALLGAILIAGHDVGRDLARLVMAQRLEGGWPTSRVRRAKASATLMPALMVAAVRGAERRRDALRLAGVDMGPRFAPIVAVAALAVAGRMAFTALPNIALTYVVVFLGGVIFGPAVGAAAGFLGMAFTDVLLSGFLPAAFVNAPAMALLGAIGGLWHGRPLEGDRRAWAMIAACAGIVLTFAFSITADFVSWLVVPEFRHSTSALVATIMLGLSFNAIPALTNGFLFAVTVVPVTQAFAALRAIQRKTG
jgi:hypothetical protein